MLVKHYKVSTVFVYIKIFITNKITYCVVNLLNLRNTDLIQVFKLLYTLQHVDVKKDKQNLNFKEKLQELISALFHIFKLKQ